MSKQRLVAVVLYEGVNSLDVSGPLEAFASVRHDDGAPAYLPQVWSIGPREVRSESGLRLCADAVAPDGAKADILIVPGGAGVRAPPTLQRLSSWLARNHRGFARVAAVCTGAYALAASGLVDGRTVATHWAHAQDLCRRYPNVRVNGDALFLRDGRFYSSGGVTAGIDLTLEMIEADYGTRAAMEAARELVVFLRRSGGQAQFSEPLKLQASASGGIAEVCRWAASHLGSDLSVEALAARAHLSPRQFSRRFRSVFGAAPAHYIKGLRLDAARTALEQGRAGIARIAAANGFKSADVFRRAFERRFKINPSEYQGRFARQGHRR